MSDLETTAHEAVTKVQSLIDALDEAHIECQEGAGHALALGRQLTEDRHALQEAVASLTHGVDSTSQALSGQAAGANASLGHVTEIVGLAAHQWEEVFTREGGALGGASDLLPQLAERLNEMAATAEAASHGVLEYANSVSQKLEQAVETAEAVVNGLSTMIADWKRGTEETVTHLLEFIEKDCMEVLSAKEADWNGKVKQLHDLLDHSFEGMAKHAQEVASYTAEKWDALLEAQLQSTQAEAHALVDTLSTLAQAVGNYEGNLQAAADMVAGQQDKAAESAAQLEQSIAQLRGRWATFGITC